MNELKKGELHEKEIGYSLIKDISARITIKL